jgi:hypothetical protein
MQPHVPLVDIPPLGGMRCPVVDQQLTLRAADDRGSACRATDRTGDSGHCSERTQRTLTTVSLAQPSSLGLLGGHRRASLHRVTTPTRRLSCTSMRCITVSAVTINPMRRCLRGCLQVQNPVNKSCVVTLRLTPLANNCKLVAKLAVARRALTVGTPSFLQNSPVDPGLPLSHKSREAPNGPRPP